ncbi:MAG: TRC40/GET3/ArsA family transport-energizing ATPase [Chloroflexi bacterium]|nr:TRC40/GET3/ArsA family transport-energizing ATPase [Chloroflexota bacterium]
MSTSFIFFSGKGGVGKTSMACATAVHYADEGKRTLIVTTDPASNLADAFEQPIGHQITPIDGVANLWAMEIDPDRATAEYQERALAPLRALFPPEVLRVMEEQLSSPCTAEVAAFDRFTDFLTAPDFDVVIFDTAPTGHTLRLLELPAEWSHTIEAASAGSGQTCIGPAAAIQEAKAKYDRALAAMRDPAATTFVFVLQPEATPIRETHRAIGELARLGIGTHQLMVNGVLPPEEARTDFLRQRVAMQAGYLAQIARELPLPARQMPLLDGEIKGVHRLQQVAAMLYGGEGRPIATSHRTDETCAPAAFWQRLKLGEAVVPRLVPANGHGRVVFFAGKGGVGKTAVSCLTAVWLARQGYRTLLLTTDPAAHLGDVLEQPVGDEAAPVQGVANLWAARIDAKAAATDYKARILADARAQGRSEQSLRAMAEELDSPCTEEMAAFDRFIDFASQELGTTSGRYDLIVFDTAPTGHTLRLLELPIDWSQQLSVKVYASVDSAAADDVAKARFGQVIETMRNPSLSTFAFVMYPESTPIVEAERAMQELRTVGIPTSLVVANLVLPPEECTGDFVCRRWQMQEKYLTEMQRRFQTPLLAVPLLSHEVRGLDVLTELGERIYGETLRTIRDQIGERRTEYASQTNN